MRKLLLASLVCFSWALTTVAQEECPPLRLRARVYPSAKRGVWAGHRAKVSVMVQSQEAVEDLAFKMELPAGLSVVKAISRPFPKTRTQPEVVQNADGTTAIYWLGVDFPHDKGSMRLFSAKLAVDACAPQTLAVTALAYLANATDLTAYCAEPLAKPAILRVRYPGVSNGRLHKHASSTPVTCAPTPAPSVNPTTPFVPLALGQRCLQAGRLAPFEDRRLSAHSDVKIERRTISDSREKRRRLGTPVVITNPTDCYNYCSLNGGEPAPFFFNWNTATDQCFCCGGECTLTFDPDFESLKLFLLLPLLPQLHQRSCPRTCPRNCPARAPQHFPLKAPRCFPRSCRPRTLRCFPYSCRPRTPRSCPPRTLRCCPRSCLRICPRSYRASSLRKTLQCFLPQHPRSCLLKTPRSCRPKTLRCCPHSYLLKILRSCRPRTLRGFLPQRPRICPRSCRPKAPRCFLPQRPRICSQNRPARAPRVSPRLRPPIRHRRCPARAPQGFLLKALQCFPRQQIHPPRQTHLRRRQPSLPPALRPALQPVLQREQHLLRRHLDDLVRPPYMIYLTDRSAITFYLCSPSTYSFVHTQAYQRWTRSTIRWKSFPQILTFKYQPEYL